MQFLISCWRQCCIKIGTILFIMVHRSCSIFLCNSVTCIPSVWSRSFFFNRHLRALSRLRSNRLLRFSSDSSSDIGCVGCGICDDDDGVNDSGSCRCIELAVVHINDCKFGRNDEAFGSCTDDVSGLVRNGANILNVNAGIVVMLDIAVDGIDPGGGHAYPPATDVTPAIADGISLLLGWRLTGGPIVTSVSLGFLFEALS